MFIIPTGERDPVVKGLTSEKRLAEGHMSGP